MRTLLIVLVVLGVIVGVPTCAGVSTYNGIKTGVNTVDEAWANVENVYQRRMDLIPNLVRIVKGSAAHESNTLKAVIQARADAHKATINIDGKSLTPENLAAFSKAQQGLSGALSKLMVLQENYPELKANAQFADLMVQLEGTENRIAVERRKYNKEVKDFNDRLVTLWGSIINNFANEKKRVPFAAKKGADVAPTVDFGDGG